jgi:HD-GYP domain-containing protein (c-di-GMP phosphodiesterase class II)
MYSAVVSKRRETPGMRPLPVIAYFAEDPVACRYFVNVQRFRRMTFEALASESPELERIVLVSNEDLVEQHYRQLRLPNTRVLALTNFRFKDPRNDGAIYAYLPQDVPETLLDRMVDNALDHIHLVHTRHEVNQRLAGASNEIHELNQIGVALSSERDSEHLLELILTKSRAFTGSDAGSIYLVEEAESAAQQTSPVNPGMAEKNGENEGQITPAREDHPRRLRFKLAQNDTVDVPFREVTMDVDERSIAGYVAQTGEIVNIEDAYALSGEKPYTINRKFDEDSGYRTRSILAVPIRNQQEKILGVLQLINAKRDFKVPLISQDDIDEQVIAFTARQQEIVLSLASQAAVAMENSRLYADIQRLFEGFVSASVTAIETRDPATSGHSFRVANLTLALAEAVNTLETGAYAGVNFSRDQMREIRYASLLHDFGKVGVREEVLVKAKKLYPAQMELIKQRFGFVRRTLENEVLQSKIKYLLEKGREEYLASVPRFDGELQESLRHLDDYLEAIIWANEPTVLPEGDFGPLLKIANVTYSDSDGHQRPLLEQEEMKLLSIRQGSLDDDERQQIEAHVLHTVTFLQAIPWTSELRNIPEIARAHHEKLNGTGYPYKLSAPEIPVQARMMTIADIFDALAAADRPYKKAVSVERALEILDLSVKDGELDPELVRVFKEARIYHRWKVEPLAY